MASLVSLLRPASKVSFDNTASGLTATNVKTALDELDTTLDEAVADIADIRTLTGTADEATDLGTFTGATISDNTDIKSALQEIETAHEEVDVNVNDLITLSGVAENATNLGTFTGSTIADSVTNKVALQSLETEVETKVANALWDANSIVKADADDTPAAMTVGASTFVGRAAAGNIQAMSIATAQAELSVDDLITLSGVAEGAVDLGTFTGTTIPDSLAIKAALQSLESAHETLASTTSLSEWQNSVLDFVTDNTAVPATEVTGDRYLLSVGGGAPNAAWDGASAGDLVEFNGTTWDATSPTTGMTVSVDDETTSVRQYGGATWDQKFYESTTASTGLTKVGFDIRLDATSAGAGLGFTTGVLSVNVDDSTIEINTDTLRVKADGINDTHIDFGTGANQVSAVDIPIADSGALITATEVEGALAENRTAIDAIEDNTITSTDGSLSVSGTVGGDNQVVETVFSTSGTANRSIDAADLASAANGLGASMTGVEDAAGNYTATEVEGVLTEIDGRLDTLESGGTNDWVVKTAAYTAVEGDKVLADSATTGAFTVTLPITPSVGDEVIIRDSERNSETAAITVGRNGSNIGGAAEDLTIDIDGAQVHLVYASAGQGWSVEAA